jgi:hypothetical protein
MQGSVNHCSTTATSSAQRFVAQRFSGAPALLLLLLRVPVSAPLAQLDCQSESSGFGKSQAVPHLCLAGLGWWVHCWVLCKQRQHAFQQHLEQASLCQNRHHDLLHTVKQRQQLEQR